MPKILKQLATGKLPPFLRVYSGLHQIELPSNQQQVLLWVSRVTIYPHNLSRNFRVVVEWFSGTFVIGWTDDSCVDHFSLQVQRGRQQYWNQQEVYILFLAPSLMLHLRRSTRNTRGSKPLCGYFSGEQALNWLPKTTMMLPHLQFSGGKGPEDPEHLHFVADHPRIGRRQ